MLPDALRKLPITSITPFTFQDYPEHTACILWFSGCNMRCGYCHNPELVKGELKKLPPEHIIDFLESRRGLLEGVVLSGGECTLCPQLQELAAYLKACDYKVKLDTNGTNPKMLETLTSMGLVDFIALDFKAPKTKFLPVTGMDIYALFQQSLGICIDSKIDMEIRTTIHTSLLLEEDINEIITCLATHNYKGNYVLQNYRHGTTLGNLPIQPKEFNTTQLIEPDFPIVFRNF